MATHSNKEEFMEALFKAAKDKRLVDIKLMPGDDEAPISAHKFVLAARSKVFSDMLEALEECKALKEETITLSELKHDELEAFHEFLYNGTLPDAKLKQHARSLYIAADKYEIPHLQDVCRDILISTLDCSSALDVIALSGMFSDKTLHVAVLGFIKKHSEEIVFSSKFQTFVESNPNIAVEVTRASLNEIKASSSELRASLNEMKASLNEMKTNRNHYRY